MSLRYPEAYMSLNPQVVEVAVATWDSETESGDVDTVEARAKRKLSEIRNRLMNAPELLYPLSRSGAIAGIYKLWLHATTLRKENSEMRLRAVVSIVAAFTFMLIISGCVPPQPPPIVYSGSYTIRDQSDIDYLDGFTEITGTLYIDKGASVSHVNLPLLWKLGNLHIHYNAATGGNTQGKLVSVQAVRQRCCTYLKKRNISMR